MEEKGAFDVIVVGAGPIGLACGVACLKADLSVLLIEKGTLSNSLVNYPVNMQFFSTSRNLEIDGVPFTSTQAKPYRQEALEYYRRIAQLYEVPINYYEEVQDISGNKAQGFKVRTNRASYTSSRVIVATGFYDIPNLLNVPGEELPHVTHYYKEPWPYVNQHVVVVGGGNSAVDAALECYRKGAHVTMLVKKESLDPGVKYWVKPDIENRIKEGSIKAEFNAQIQVITTKSVEFSQNGTGKSVQANWVLALTGYQPNYKLLQKFGIEIGPDWKQMPCYNEETHETNVPGMYLAGVVCGGLNTRMFFIENSREHADNIVRHIMRQPR